MLVFVSPETNGRQESGSRERPNILAGMRMKKKLLLITQEQYSNTRGLKNRDHRRRNQTSAVLLSFTLTSNAPILAHSMAMAPLWRDDPLNFHRHHRVLE